MRKLCNRLALVTSVKMSVVILGIVPNGLLLATSVAVGSSLAGLPSLAAQ